MCVAKDGDGLMNIQKNCEACGDLISVRLADHKRGWGRFCNKACAGAHKFGQRPRDVNAEHAKKSIWAKDRFEHFQSLYGDGKRPKAPTAKDQVGKVKVKPIYHSPSYCRICGTPMNGLGLCSSCDDEQTTLNDMETGWDGHKVWKS